MVRHKGSIDAFGHAGSNSNSKPFRARLMKAMIFAAGLGTRLGELSRERPKALVDVNGKTALRLAAGKLVSEGFDDLIINICLLYTSPSPRDGLLSRMPSSA